MTEEKILGTYVAEWNITLDVRCPSCLQDVNLLDDPDFFDGRGHIQIGEHDTEATERLPVDCPECGAGFYVDLVF